MPAGDGVMLRKRFGLFPVPGVGKAGGGGWQALQGRERDVVAQVKLFLVFSVQNNPGVCVCVGGCCAPFLLNYCKKKSPTLRNSSSLTIF